MSSRKSLFTVGLSLAALALVVLVGCGGDDKTTSSGNSLTGTDYNSAVNQVNALIDSTLSVVGKGLTTVIIGTTQNDFDQVPGLFYGSGIGDGDASSDGEWLVVTNTNLSTGVTNYYLDSIQYLRVGQPYHDAATADAMTVKHYWQRYADDTTSSYEAYEMRGNLGITTLSADNATVNGINTLSLEKKTVGTQETVWENFRIVSALQSLSIGSGDNTWMDGCPASGTVTADVQYVRTAGAAAPDTTNFEFTFTFENGSVSTLVASGTQTNVYTTDFCTVSGN
jgi:hypothetical protein